MVYLIDTIGENINRSLSICGDFHGRRFCNRRTMRCIVQTATEPNSAVCTAVAATQNPAEHPVSLSQHAASHAVHSAAGVIGYMVPRSGQYVSAIQASS